MTRDVQRLINQISDEVDRVLMLDPHAGRELVDELAAKLNQRWLPITHTAERTEVVDRAVNVAAEAYELPMDLIYTRLRTERVAHARFTSWLLLEAVAGFRPKEIAAQFGRSVSMVNHGTRRLLALIETDDKIAERVRHASMTFKGKEVGK